MRAHFLIRRLLWALATAWLVVTATFVLVRLAPGDPADLFDHPGFDSSTRAALSRAYGLERPLAVQYGRWVAATLGGNLGVSFVERRPVTAMLADTLPNTLLLAGAALAIDFGVGILVALACAWKPRGGLDTALGGAAMALHAIPLFCLALMALAVFSYGAGLFPPSHRLSVDAESWGAVRRGLDLLHHLALPALVLGLASAASTSRYVRGDLLEAMAQEFMRAARGKGLSKRVLICKHAFANALGPLITLFGLSLPALVSGSLVVEVIFSWPGMGRLAYDALLARDYPVILACTTAATGAVLFGSLVADVLYVAADPRVAIDGVTVGGVARGSVTVEGVAVRG